MGYCTAAEGQKFQQEATRISEIIEKLGSNPLKESLSLEKNKDSAKGTKKKQTV